MSIASSSFGGPHAHSKPQRGERADDGHQAARPLGELVVHARRDLAVALAGQQPVGDHAVQPGAQLLGRDAGQHALELDEPAGAGDEIADDQQGPLVSHQVQRPCVGRPLVVRVTLGGRDGGDTGLRRTVVPATPGATLPSVRCRHAGVCDWTPVRTNLRVAPRRGKLSTTLRAGSACIQIRPARPAIRRRAWASSSAGRPRRPHREARRMQGVALVRPGLAGTYLGPPSASTALSADLDWRPALSGRRAGLAMPTPDGARSVAAPRRPPSQPRRSSGPT